MIAAQVHIDASRLRSVGVYFAGGQAQLQKLAFNFSTIERVHLRTTFVGDPVTMLKKMNRKNSCSE